MLASTPRAKPEKKSKSEELIAAVYVDEPKSSKGRRKELVEILQNFDFSKAECSSSIIFDSVQSDLDEHVMDAIATVERHGIKVAFAH